MRSINFRWVAVEGFGSFQLPAKFSLDRGGVNIVMGDNGKGKTTLFAAIVFVLFKQDLKGRVLSKIPTWEEQRNENFRGTRVVVEFDDGTNAYRVARHIDFDGTTLGLQGDSRLMIFMRDMEYEDAVFGEEHLLSTEQYKGDQQAFIERVLGVNAQGFLNSVLFGQRMKRLVQASNDEKRDLFEKLFAAEFVDAAREKAKLKAFEVSESKNELVKKADTLVREVETLNRDIAYKEMVVHDFEKNKKGRIELAQEEVKEFEESLKTEQVSLAGMQKLAAKYDEAKEQEYENAVAAQVNAVNAAKDKLREAEEELRECQAEIRKSESTINRLNEDRKDINKKCPTCGAAISKDKVDKVYDAMTKAIQIEQTVLKELGKRLKGYEEAYNVAGANFEAVQSAKDSIKKEADEYVQSVGVYRKASNELLGKHKWVQRCEGDLERAKNRLKKAEEEKGPEIDFDSLKQQVADKSKEGEKLSKKILTQVEELERVEWWIKYGFGSSGVKAFIFNSMLSQLNDAVEKYAARYGLRVEFSVDLSKARKPFKTTCYKKGFEKDYDDYSGGQAQRVDVCLAFAMYDIVSAKTQFNILIMDEVFEGLDREGEESVFELIRMKADEGKTIYVITHSDSLDSMYSKHIMIEQDEKENSYIIEN